MNEPVGSVGFWPVELMSTMGGDKKSHSRFLVFYFLSPRPGHKLTRWVPVGSGQGTLMDIKLMPEINQTPTSPTQQNGLFRGGVINVFLSFLSLVFCLSRITVPYLLTPPRAVIHPPRQHICNYFGIH